MATFYIREYTRAAVDGRGGLVLAGEEPGVDQTPVTISGSGAVSAQFKPSTRFVRVHTDAICSILFGATNSISATTSNARLAANQTEFFGIAPNAALFVAVIANT